MANVTDLKNAIASYLTRNLADFVAVGSRDILLQAINNAKNYAQRAADFEYARVYTKVLNVVPADGGNLDNAVLYSSGTAVKLKSAEHGFVALTSGGEYPVAIISRASYNDRLKRLYANVTSSQDAESMQPSINPTDQFYVFSGRTFYLYPKPSANYTAYFDGIEWIQDWSTGSETSFLLDYCFDYLLLRSIYELNLYLKEDMRVPISEKVMADHWQNIIHWNSTVITNSTDNASLD